MQLTTRSLNAIAEIVTGNTELSPYRSGPVLVSLFNDFGFSDTYQQGFPSRFTYVSDRVAEMNGNPELARLIREALDPRDLLEAELDVQPAIDYLNQRLRYDGYEVVPDGEFVRVRTTTGGTVDVRPPAESLSPLSAEFIQEQIEKAENKIRDEDYDGAITNARSLVEAVLCAIENQVNENPPKYDGDLPRLYKRVQKHLNLEPARTDIDQPLKQVLTGLVSIVTGIAAVRNKMSDSHVRTYRPAQHHAVLVVNAAKTLVGFLFETKQFQEDKAKERKASE